MAEIQTARRKRKRNNEQLPKNGDEEITDPSSEEVENSDNESSERSDAEVLSSDEEFSGENPADKRRRLAKQYLGNLKDEANDIMREESQTKEGEVNKGLVDDYSNFDAREMDKDILASRLQQDVAEQHGRVHRFIADKLLLSEATTCFTRVGENNLTCISCFVPPVNKFNHLDDQRSAKNRGKLFAYTVSKDLQLTKYDVTDFSKRPKKLKYVKGGAKYIPENPHEYENTTMGHYKEILTVAASPDGKYVVTGGRDKKVIVWSTESLAPLRVFPTKDRRGEVISLLFRRNTDQLYVACADYKIRTYSINQLSQLETLYGHHDIVVDVSSLGLERCVTVGARDKTAMLWKIPDETRLTFRGGDDTDRLKKKWLRENSVSSPDGEVTSPNESEIPAFYSEGSIDVVSMIDDSHFVTGSDNGNICLWSLAKKKPVYTMRASHGIIPLPELTQISGEASDEVKSKQLEEKRLARPYWVTALHAIPYSNIFISGSWNGNLKVWKLAENMREFSLLGDLSNCKGVVTKIQVVESGKHGKETFRVLATVAKEHKLGRWISKVPAARNGIYSAVIQQGIF